MKKLVAFLLVVITIFDIIPVKAASVNNVKEQSLEEILQYYQEQISKKGVINDINSQAKQTISNIFEERYETLQKAGYFCYQLNESNYDQLEKELETNFSEIGLDKSSSYLIVLDNSDSETVTRGTVTQAFNYTYDGVTYKMRTFVVTANDLESSPSYSQSSVVNLISSTATDLLNNCLNTAISAVISSASATLGTVASICGLNIQMFGTTSSATLNLHAASNWTKRYTQVYNDYDKTWSYCSCVENVYTSSYISGQYYNKGVNMMAKVPENYVSNFLYSPYYNDTNWQRSQAAIAFRSNSTCIYSITGAVKYYYGNKVKITHNENF